MARFIADRRNPALAGAHWVIGAAMTLSAAVVAVILAVVFAATLAVAAVVVGAALAAWATMMRVRRPAAVPVTLEARKVGHAWVAYGWDRLAG